MKIICNKGEGREKDITPGFINGYSSKWSEGDKTHNERNPKLPVYDQSGNRFLESGEHEASIIWQYFDGAAGEWVIDETEHDHLTSLELRLPTRQIYRILDPIAPVGQVEIKTSETEFSEVVKENPVPNWYDEMSINNWLTNKLSKRRITRYAIKLLSQTISSDYANELQRAFAKGWEKAYNQAKKNSINEYIYYPKTEKQVDELNQSNLIDEGKIIELLERKCSNLRYSSLNEKEVSRSQQLANSTAIAILEQLIKEIKSL